MEELGRSRTSPTSPTWCPGQFYEQALLPTAQQIVQGKITGEQAGDLAAKVAKEWRDFNPGHGRPLQEVGDGSVRLIALGGNESGVAFGLARDRGRRVCVPAAGPSDP